MDEETYKQIAGGVTEEEIEDKQNQNLLKALRRLLNEQTSEEKYLFGKREFKNLVE